MSNNFKFQSNQIRDKICLKLYGDFDGSSACELINVIKNYRNGSNQILIDTDNLNTIHPSGIDVFNKNLSVMDININNIIITGKYGFSLEQPWCWFTFKSVDTPSTYFVGANWTIKKDLLFLKRLKKGFKRNSLISG